MEKYFFTNEGYEKYKAKVELATKELQDVHAQMGDAAENGGDGWHDNFSLEELHRTADMLSQKYKSMRKILDSAKIISFSSRNSEEIKIGSKVKMNRNGSVEEWFVCGYGESDPKEKKMAYNTPLAQALIGKKAGDNVEFRKLKISILEVS